MVDRQVSATTGPQIMSEVHTLQDALRRFAEDETIRTHSGECWKWHRECAMLYAAHMIDGLLDIGDIDPEDR